MNEAERLGNVVSPQDSLRRWRTKQKPDRTVRLGDTLNELMESCISQQARFEPVFQLWSQLLPGELDRHCKIVDISSGQLTVLVDSPSYMHELRLLSSELLSELQSGCPRAKIKKLKFAIGR